MRNAGSIRQQGLELELVGRPSPDLTLTVSGVRLLSEYTDFKNAPGLPAFGGVQNLTGSRPNFSPKWQGLVMADYRSDLGDGWNFGINGRLNYTSAIDIGGAGDGNPQGIEPAYALLAARFALYSPDERWEFAISGENLTSKGFCTLRFGQTFAAGLGLQDSMTGGGVHRCVLGEPRSLRVSAKVKF